MCASYKVIEATFYKIAELDKIFNKFLSSRRFRDENF